LRGLVAPENLEGSFAPLPTRTISIHLLGQDFLVEVPDLAIDSPEPASFAVDIPKDESSFFESSLEADSLKTSQTSSLEKTFEENPSQSDQDSSQLPEGL
jgi:hypothetical protein